MALTASNSRPALVEVTALIRFSAMVSNIFASCGVQRCNASILAAASAP
jgi:hypothetical protein